MGVNYGQRRGRMEILGGVSNSIGYALGIRKLKYSHIDEEVFYEITNRHLDRVEERFRNRNV